MRRRLRETNSFGFGGFVRIIRWDTLRGNRCQPQLIRERTYDNLVITVQSPQNKTYIERTIPINFTVETNNEEQGNTCYILNDEKPVNVGTRVVSTRTETGWYLEGSVDRNYTFTYSRYTAQGNAILENLADGTYNLTIQRFFPDELKPEGLIVITTTTISFTVDASAPQSTPFPLLNNSDGSAATAETGEGFPTWTYIAAAVSVATVSVIVVGVLTYFKKRKHPTNQAAQHKQ